MSRVIAILSLMMFSLFVSAQNDKKLVRKGNNLYANKKYPDAEIFYRKALEKKADFPTASYNLGNSLFKQNKLNDAADQYNKLAGENKLTKNQLAMVYHNLGNTLLQSQKIEESIDAYKKSLRNNSRDMETKYNLAFAQRLLKNPPKQNKQNQKNNKDQQNKDQKKEKSKQDQDKNKEKQNQSQQPQEGKLSKEDAKRMLEAVQNDENNLQKKLEKEKEQGKKINPEKNW